MSQLAPGWRSDCAKGFPVLRNLPMVSVVLFGYIPSLGSF